MSTAVSLINATLTRNARRVLRNIARDTGATHCGILAQDLDLSIDTVRKHTNALAAAGLVKIECVGQRIPTNVEVTEPGRFSGGAFWTQKTVPSREWCKEGETDRAPGPNTYYLSVTETGHLAALDAAT